MSRIAPEIRPATATSTKGTRNQFGRMVASPPIGSLPTAALSDEDDAHSRMIWTHPKLRTYYRNSRGRVVVNIPWRVVDYWEMLRDVDLEDYLCEPAVGA